MNCPRAPREHQVDTSSLLMGLGAPPGHSASIVSPKDLRQTWLQDSPPSSASISSSCASTSRRPDAIWSISWPPQHFSSTCLTEVIDLHLDTQTGFMDFFVKQTFWPHMVKSKCRRQRVSHVWVSRQLALWSTDLFAQSYSSPKHHQHCVFYRNVLLPLNLA